MINLTPSSSTDRTTLSSVSIAVSKDRSIKNYIYTFTESYYDHMLTSVQNYLLENKSLSSINKESLEWIIPNSAKFNNFIKQNNKLIVAQIKVIHDYMTNDKDDYAKQIRQSFAHKTYHVSVDIKDGFIVMPNDIAESIDKLDLVENALRDPKFYKKMVTKLYFIGFVPLWITKYTTTESMTSYLEQNSKTIIYEGFYTIKELLPKFIDYFKNFDGNFDKIKETTKRNKRQLDMLLDRIVKRRSYLLKIHNKDDDMKSKITSLFNLYEAIIDLFYIQLSVYQRSIITLYGKMFTEIGNIVHDMFYDINDNKVQASVLQYTN